MEANPYQPPDAPLEEAAPKTAWKGVFLDILFGAGVCVLIWMYLALTHYFFPPPR